MSFRSSSSTGPMTLSQVPGCPSFRSSAVNAVAVIPLLSSDKTGQDNPNTFSSKSFQDLLDALNRYNSPISDTRNPGDDLLLVVPNSNLTRPGDWKYENTPFKNFHWQHGCQRMIFFDGRPYNSRMAHDRLINHELTRNWIDLCPHRRTAALIGVLNVRDCPDEETLKRAEQEWQQWAERYSTPPYEVTAHGRDFERDNVVQRLFVFDSFHEANKVDVSKTSLGSSLVAFPPADEDKHNMMDLHMNVVVNDLAVAIFQELEGKIRDSDAITKGTDGQPLSSSAAKSRFFQRTASTSKSEDSDTPQGSDNLSISNLASVVSPDSSLASPAAASTKSKPTVTSKLPHDTAKGSSSEAQLLTPMDDVWDYAELNPKDAQEMLRREVGRREKFAADHALLAGSPLDAYERYMKAADLCRTTCPDPLWYAAALEGCAASHIAMAEAGGFSVDEYLETSFHLEEEMMACAVIPSGEKTNKQTMSGIVSALCDDALNVLSRHPKLACFRAELLLKLAWYTGEVEDTHLRCRWGMGDGCYPGDAGSDKRRWELASATQFNFLDLKTKKGEDVVAHSTLRRCKKWTSYMHQATSSASLDSTTRADVALRCASLCLKGLRPTNKPISIERSGSRIQFRRKASFFTVAAAEAMSDLDAENPDDRAGALWMHASKMLSESGNGSSGGSYGWATLRSVALHSLALQGLRESSEEAAVELLSLMGEISPPKRPEESGLFFSKFDAEQADDSTNNFDDSDGILDNASYIAAESVVSAARTYVRERAKGYQSRGANFFTGQTATSSLLTVAQSKWVEDDPLPPILFPMADFSDFSYSVIAMRSVWSTIKLENCFAAQKKLVKQISDLRKNMPTSSLSEASSGANSSLLPISIITVSMVESESRDAIQRVKVKVPQEEDKGAMATFFNPYANKKGQSEATIVPEGEERYILVHFANRLSIPLEIPRCQLEFDSSEAGQIKAPAISFVIPGQSDDFTVQFPFILLPNDSRWGSKDEPTRILEIKGLQLTCLARSFYLPLASPSKNPLKPSRSNLPDSGSFYDRRNYDAKKKEKNSSIKSPRLEVVPSQPNLSISFASSWAPINENTVIPAPIADGETFVLPQLRFANDTGISGSGTIHELKVTAVGVPGHPQQVLYDLNGNSPPEEKAERSKAPKKPREASPLTLTAHCHGFDQLNTVGGNSAPGSMSVKLSAKPNMGAHTSGCKIKLVFRYRGQAPSASMEIWKKREIEIRVLRIKGPRISSLTFRPDLAWGSAYSNLCFALSKQDEHKRYRPHKVRDESELPITASTDDEDFIASRLGRDPGVNVCGDKTVVFVSIANETSSAIELSSEIGKAGGFETSPMETFRVQAGVSGKIPVVLPRVDRSPDIAKRLLEMTTFNWKSQIDEKEANLAMNTSGSMIPVNRRVRQGTISIPTKCLKAIIDENPTFLSRICKAPCSIEVAIAGHVKEQPFEIELRKPVDVTCAVNLAKWVPVEVLKQSNVTLQLFCAPRALIETDEKSHVWCGQIRKTLPQVKEERTFAHRARLLFLKEGVYDVSACLSFNRTDVEDDVKEIWWSQQAQQILVKDLPFSQ